MAVLAAPHLSNVTGDRTVTAAITALRVAGAGLLGTNAGIHAYLWDAGYRSIPTIGVLFLLDVIGASVLMLAVLAAPRRLLWTVAALGALFELGTAGGLYLSTRHTLFGFVESSRATLYRSAANTEIAGTIVLAVLAGLVLVTLRRARTSATIPWW